MRTRVAELLGVEFPICAFSHYRDVDTVGRLEQVVKQ